MTRRGDSPKKLALIAALHNALPLDPNDSVSEPWPNLPPVPRFIDVNDKTAPPRFSKEYFDLFKKPNGSFMPRTSTHSIYLMFGKRNLNGQGRSRVRDDGGWEDLKEAAKRGDEEAKEKLFWIDRVSDEQKRCFAIYYPEYKKPAPPPEDKAKSGESSGTRSPPSTISLNPYESTGRQFQSTNIDAEPRVIVFSMHPSVAQYAPNFAPSSVLGPLRLGMERMHFHSTENLEFNIRAYNRQSSSHHPHATHSHPVHLVEEPITFIPQVQDPVSLEMRLLTFIDAALRDMGESHAANFFLDLSENVRHHGLSEDDALETFFDVLDEFCFDVTELEDMVANEIYVYAPYIDTFARSFFGRVDYYLMARTQQHSGHSVGDGIVKRAFDYEDDTVEGEACHQRARL